MHVLNERTWDRETGTFWSELRQHAGKQEATT